MRNLTQHDEVALEKPKLTVCKKLFLQASRNKIFLVCLTLHCTLPGEIERILSCQKILRSPFVTGGMDVSDLDMCI
uniref:Uncharacterized protein n=1 Tax=Pararge aegeria TaxID=116150 RepID=S4NMK5_9NEOP